MLDIVHAISGQTGVLPANCLMCSALLFCLTLTNIVDKDELKFFY